MIPLVVLRPEPGCAATVVAARAAGMRAHGFPLFEVRALAWEPPDRAEFDALLIGSANALRHGGPALERYRGMPAYVVGPATAAQATEAGLEVAGTGTGGLQAVLDGISHRHGRLLRLAGRDRVRLSPTAGVTIDERVVYASEALPMPDDLASLLGEPAVVLLHSAEAARHFAREADSRGIARARLRLAAIGPRVAEAAGAGWSELRTAGSADETALLALAGEMCQMGDSSQQGPTRA